MRNQQMPDWLDDLVTIESNKIAKQAEDNSEKMSELEKKIDAAETPEELDAIEKELDALENESPDEESSEESSDESTIPKIPGTEDSDTEGDDDETSADDSDVLKEVKEVKKEVTDEKDDIQRKLLNQITTLNDQLGLNKIVDLNSTIDQGA